MLLSTKEERNFTTKFAGESYTVTSSPKEFPDNVGGHLMRLFGGFLNVGEPPPAPEEPVEIEIEEESEGETVIEESAPIEKIKRTRRKLKIKKA